jgi:energy-coupling factor transporter ATP-binding protein EcfA2
MTDATILFDIQSLTKTYQGEASSVHARRGVDLLVEQGEMIVLRGPSGSGKSTLLNILGGLDRATSSEILFEGEDLARAIAADIVNWVSLPLSAIVRAVEPQPFTKGSALGVEEQRVLGLLQVTAPAEHWTQLAAGYRLWGQGALRSVSDAKLIPIGALARDGDAWAAFVVEKGRARLEPLRISTVTNHDAEGIDGSNIGDQVIADPTDPVRDGARVRARLLQGAKPPKSQSRSRLSQRENSHDGASQTVDQSSADRHPQRKRGPSQPRLRRFAPRAAPRRTQSARQGARIRNLSDDPDRG